jgi:hypothetical protein
MPQKRPAIHDEWISVMSEERKSSLSSLQERHESVSLHIEQMALPETFIAARQELLAIKEEQAQICREGLEHSLNGGTMTKKDFDIAVARITAHRLEIGRERVVLKKSKRTVSSDMMEMMPNYDSLSEAYSSLVSSMVLGSSKLGQSQKKETDRGELRKRAYEMYECRRLKDPQDKLRVEEFWCSITREWWSGSVSKSRPPPIKIAHIVPRAFLRVPHQTMKMFDEDTATLSINPRNSLPMHKVLEEAFDSYALVIVPLPPKQGETVKEFRCILADSALANQTFDQGRKYKEVDGVQLQFLNDSRPASRYLYLKYCCAFLYWHQEGQTAWAQNLPSKGYIWATPGEYIRRSMLANLAKGCEDLYLPEAFYKDNTFDDSKSSEVADVDQEDASLTFTGEVVRMYKKTGRLGRDEEDEKSPEVSESEED